MENAVLEITYSFQFAGGMTEDFHVAVDTATGDLLSAPHESSAPWTRLEFKKCRDCKLAGQRSCRSRSRSSRSSTPSAASSPTRRSPSP